MRSVVAGSAKRLGDADAVHLGLQMGAPDVIEEPRSFFERRAARATRQTLDGVQRSHLVRDLEDRLYDRLERMGQRCSLDHGSVYCNRATIFWKAYSAG